MESNDHKIIDGSLKTILNVSLPLILSALSSNLLYIIDRMILARYSINSMNAAAMSGNLLAIYCFFWSTISGIAEVYVGQSNGRKEYKNLALPVWQMIYFSLIGFIFYFPFGYFADYLNLLPDYCKEEGIQYSKVMTYLAAMPALKMAFASFFIGQGKTKIITYTVLLGSIANAILDVVFVFGYENIIPSMGCKGAAIATILSEVIEIVIFASVFFNKQNRNNFNTLNNRKFNKEIFFGCLKLGAPMSVGRIFELMAWYLIYAAVSHVSNDLATVQGICVSVYILFAFVCDGLSKSAATISSNLIGQKDLKSIQKAFRIFMAVVAFLGFMMAIPLAVFPESLFYFLDKVHDDISHLYPSIAVIFKILVFEISFEAAACAIWGILMSGGDTRYPMLVNLLFLWGIVVAPLIVMFFMKKLDSAEIIYWLSAVWDILVFYMFYRRYKSLKWYQTIKFPST